MKALFIISVVLFVVVSPLRSVANDQLKVGADRIDQYIPDLKGKKVGVVVNNTSVIDGVHIVDLLISNGVDVKRIFAPEHGFRGDADAGAHVEDSKDPKTGVEVLSLYGKSKKPTEEMIDDLDAVIFDIQDVGCRFYTYITTMHYVMDRAAECGVEFIVLDRPNPNIDLISGPILDMDCQSFIGYHPIPVSHGLTVGELALMIQGEGWLECGEEINLKVITVDNYTRDTRYELPIKPSPNLPNYQSIRQYPYLCFFESTFVSVGRGTDFPFQTIGYKGEGYGDFEFTPRSIIGASTNPKLKGENCSGDDLQTLETPKYLLEYVVEWSSKFDSIEEFISSRRGFAIRVGNDQVYDMIKRGDSAKEIEESWKDQLDDYMVMRKKYLLYK